MSKYIPEDKIEEIKNRADIVTVISEYLSLRKAGRNLLGLCPFHQEKTPSFTVSPEKQIFYCFGCGAGGHVFAFLMKINGMSFPDAVRYLAEKTGVVVDGLDREQDYGKQSIREQIISVNQLAAEFFTKTLYSAAGNSAREYLSRRGLNEETARRFSLGYSPPAWTNLRDFFQRRGTALDLVCQAGLIIAKNADYYDRFRGRLIFPIFNSTGAIVAFGGRSLDDSVPKYLNSPETPVYTKGKNLYGLFLTREAIRARDLVVLVEGYFDLLSLWNVGIENCVATLGTALTAEQVDLLRRFTRNVVVLFDSDQAGQKAMRRSLELFLTSGVQARVLVLPKGDDPDSFVRAHGKTRLTSEIDAAYPLVDYFIEEVIGRSGSFEDIREVTREAVSLMAAIENPLERDIFVKRVADRLAIDHDSLKKEIERQAGSKLAGPKEEKPQRQSARMGDSMGDSKEDMPELGLLHIMLERPEKIPGLYQSGIFSCFGNEEAKKLGETIHEVYAQQGAGRFDASFILNDLVEGPLRTRLLKLMMAPTPYTTDILDRVVEDIASQIRKRWLRKKHLLLNRDLLKAETRGDREECRRILEEKSRLIIEERETKV